MVKEPVSALSSHEFGSVAAHAKSEIFVAHLRKATIGEHTVENCHPFVCGQWLFAHNGTVDREALLNRLDPERCKSLTGDTDSEVFFQLILQEIDKDPVNGMAKAIAETKKYPYTSLKFILTNGQTLYAYRHAVEKLDYYTLYYLQLGTEPQRAVVVCSEKLTDGEWLEIPVGNLLIVENGVVVPLRALTK